ISFRGRRRRSRLRRLYWARCEQNPNPCAEFPELREEGFDSRSVYSENRAERLHSPLLQENRSNRGACRPLRRMERCYLKFVSVEPPFRGSSQSKAAI